jgi:hypothetical protein
MRREGPAPMKHLSVREELKGDDIIPIGGAPTCWPVREEGSDVPVAAFCSEQSALEFCLRKWAEELV